MDEHSAATTSLSGSLSVCLCITILLSHCPHVHVCQQCRGGVRVRVWIREQRKIKRRSKALLSLWWQTWTSLSVALPLLSWHQFEWQSVCLSVCLLLSLCYLDTSLSGSLSVCLSVALPLLSWHQFEWQSVCLSVALPLLSWHQFEWQSVCLSVAILTSLSPTQLTGVVEKLMEQLQQKGKELNEFRQKHNIQVREERDSKTQSDSRDKSGASQGVLVS